MKKRKKRSNFFERFSDGASRFTGSPTAFIAAAIVVVGWAILGPVFDYSSTWQLFINTGTTIITFLMVFLIQKAQNKDSKAIQIKLNELIAANRYASNRMVDIEDLAEDELDQLHKFYEKLSELAEEDDDIHESHSIDVAMKSNAAKSKLRKRAHPRDVPVPAKSANSESVTRAIDKERQAVKKKPMKKQTSNEDRSKKS